MNKEKTYCAGCGRPQKTYCAGCGSLLGIDPGEAEPDHNEDFCSKRCYKEFVSHEHGWDEKDKSEREIYCSDSCHQVVNHT